MIHITIGNLANFMLVVFTRAIDEESESPVFLKNVGDKVKLSFLLNQDIAKLNGNDDLSIEQDDDGYDRALWNSQNRFW